MEKQFNDGRARTTEELVWVKAQLENLIPLAVVVAFGCEHCAEVSVKKALQNGSSGRDIRKVLAIIESMKTVDCLVQRVGLDIVGRIEKPLAAAFRTLDKFQYQPRDRKDVCC